MILSTVSWPQVTMRSRIFSFLFVLQLVGFVISCGRKFSSKSKMNVRVCDSYSCQFISGKLKSPVRYNGFLVNATTVSILFRC